MSYAAGSFPVVLTGRRYLLDLTSEQVVYAEQVAAACRSVWNTGLEQRQAYRRRDAYINYVEQAAQMAAAKSEYDWLAAVPAVVLQQTLRDLDRACRTNGTWKVHWRSKARTAPSFRFPDPAKISVKRLNRRWGEARLPKFGWVRFRWTQPVGGTVRNATVLRDGGCWYVSFCVEDGVLAVEPNGKPPIGVDRGVVVAIATSDHQLRDRDFVTSGETNRLRRLNQRWARQRKGSNRRRRTSGQITGLNARMRHRRDDFCAWTANRLTAGLNRAILAKGWGKIALQLQHKARYNGSEIVKVPAAYTSQTCNACGHVARENRESQAVFRCVSCGHQAHADVNAAKNILAAGLAVTGRGDLGIARSTKRQLPELVAA